MTTTTTVTPWLFLDWDGYLAFVGTEADVLGAQLDYLRLGRQCFVTNLTVGTPGGMAAINERVARSRIVDDAAVGEWCATLTEYVTTVGTDSPLAVIPPPTDWRWLLVNPLGGVRWWKFTKPSVFRWQPAAVHAYFSAPSPAGADESMHWAETKRTIVCEAAADCAAHPGRDWIAALEAATVVSHPAIIHAALPLPPSLLTHRLPYLLAAPQ
jgi:hypothetical protein